jgi:amino acid adenylation domain-containing protein
MGATYTLTAGQRAVWHATAAGAGAALHVCRQVRLDGPLDLDSLTSAIEVVCDGLDVLHRRYTQDGDDCRCESVERAAVPVEIVDATGLGARDHGARAEKYAARPFDLAGQVALRALVERTDGGGWLTFVAHHLALDGWSLDHVVRDVLDSFAGGKPEARGSMDGGAGTVGVKGDLEWPAMPDRVLDEADPHDTTVAVHQVRLDQGIADGLRQTARTHSFSTAHALMAVYAAVLHGWADLEEIAFLAPVDVRSRSQRRSLGMGVNSIVVGSRLEADATFVDFARVLRDRFLVSYEQRAHAVVDLARAAGMARRADGTSVLTDFEFNLMRAWEPPASLTSAGIAAHVEPHVVPAAQYDVSLSAIEAEGIELCWQVRGRTAGVETAKLLHRLFTRCAAAFVADPLAVVARVPLLDEREVAELVGRGAGPEVAVNPVPIVTRVLRHAAATPRRVAIECGGSRCTYAELEQAVLSTRCVLGAAGVQPRSRVVVWMERGRAVVETMLAIWSAGAVYVPIDVGNPPDRVRAMLQQVGADIVVVDVAARTQSVDVDVPVVVLGASPVPPGPVSLEHTHPRASDAAYVMFTSGSTGLPKAVAIHHAGMVNHLDEMLRVGGVEPHDTFGQLAPLAFDVHIWQLLAPLVLGGRLRILSQEELADPLAIADSIERERITVLQAVPSYLDIWGHLAEVTRAASCPTLRTLYVTGEAFTQSLVSRLRLLFPNATLINAYGPAEASDDVALHVVDGEVEEPVVPIGGPIANARLYVIDRWGRLRPPGLLGELAIGGLPVGLGYLGDDARPAFRSDPWQDGSALYLSGDVCSLRDGVVHFLGRKDHQVKIGGRRVELGEIETTCAALPGVTAAHALVMGEGTARIICFVTGVRRLDVPGVEAALRDVLPDYMVPRVVQVEQLPTTRNGKIDQDALREFVDTSRPLEAPSGLHDVVRAAWARVLGTDEFDLDDNFFRLGGDSLRALSLIAELRSQGVPAEVGALYHGQSLRAFLQSLALRDQDSNLSRVLLPEFVQQHDLDAFVQGVRLTVDGKLDEVERAVRAAVAAHVVLRSAIEATNQGWVLSREDLSDPHGRVCRPGDDLDAVALSEIGHERLVAWAVRPAGDAVDVALAVHHAVADDQSLYLLIGDLERALRGADLEAEAHYFSHCRQPAKDAGPIPVRADPEARPRTEAWSRAAVVAVPDGAATSRVCAAVTARLALWWAEVTGTQTLAVGTEWDLRFGTGAWVRGVGCHVGVGACDVRVEGAELAELIDACEAALATPATAGTGLDGLDLLVNVLHRSAIPDTDMIHSVRRMPSVAAVNRASMPVPVVVDLVCGEASIEVLLHGRQVRVPAFDALQTRLDEDLVAAALDVAKAPLPAGHDLVGMDPRELRDLLDQLAGEDG